MTESNVAYTEPIEVNLIRKGMVILLKENPCKIIEISISKTGKHGHAKAHLVGIDIFTKKKCEDLSPTSHPMQRVLVKNKKYQFCGFDEGFLILMDESGGTREDIRIPEDSEMVELLENEDEEKVTLVHIMSAMGKEQVEKVTRESM